MPDAGLRASSNGIRGPAAPPWTPSQDRHACPLEIYLVHAQRIGPSARLLRDFLLDHAAARVAGTE